MKNAFIFIACMQSALPIYAQSLSVEKIEKIKNAMVYIKVMHKDPLNGEEITSTGSGFFIGSNGLIATNYHVVQAIQSTYGVVYPAPLSEIRIISNSGKSIYGDVAGSIISVDKKNDLAILRINDTLTTPYLNIDGNSDLLEGMPVWVFGYPFGDAFAVIQRGPEITVTKGAITALRHDDRAQLNAIQIDAAVNPGNSGGPLINDSGNVIGIVNISGGSTNMNFAVPGHFLAKKTSELPSEAALPDTVSCTIVSSPPGAALFIDWHASGTTPVEQLKLIPGLHTICIIKKGYETHIEERVFLPDSNSALSDSIHVTLSPVKSISLKVSEANLLKVKSGQNLPQETLHYYAPDTAAILMEEDFSDPSKFDLWEQSTGGADSRSWYLEDGALHQFEDNGLLHSILLGDTSWSDYMMRAKLKITGGQGDSRAGLIFRETADGFYLFRIHKKSEMAQLAYHCKNPFGWSILMEKKLGKNFSEEPFSIAVWAVGKSIGCFLDTVCVFNTSSDFTELGRVGFYSVESKPVFDSLLISRKTLIPDEITPPDIHELQSFWFTDNFNLESEWWYQYSGQDEKPSPWYFSDGGMALLSKDNEKRTSEFTKYRLTSYKMGLVVSFGGGSDSSEFEIFSGKHETGEHTLVFSKIDQKVRLIEKKGNEVRTLKSAKLPSGFFSKIHALTLVIANNRVICRTTREEVISYENKRFFPAEGSFGFSATNLRMVFHQLSMTSVRADDLVTGKK